MFFLLKILILFESNTIFIRTMLLIKPIFKFKQQNRISDRFGKKSKALQTKRRREINHTLK